MKKKPSVSSINRYLQSEKKAKTYKRKKDLPSGSVNPTSAPFDVVQLDGEGNKVIENIGALTVINLKDVHSKVYVLSFPLSLKSKFSNAKRKDYQNCIRLAFIEFGRFKKLQVDHESVFYDNVSGSPFPTPFHLWMIGLGVELCFTPKGKPQQQGSVERSHRTMHKQVFEGKIYQKWEEILEASWKRRNRLNHHIPSRMLNNQPPLKAFPEAKHSGKKYSLKGEKKLFKEQRIYEYLARCEGWFRAIRKTTINLGGHTYYIKNKQDEKETKIVFNLSTGHFDFFNSNQELIGSIQPKGLSFNDLKGDLNKFIIWEKEHRQFMPKK